MVELREVRVFSLHFLTSFTHTIHIGLNDEWPWCASLVFGVGWRTLAKFHSDRADLVDMEHLHNCRREMRWRQS